MDSGSDTIRKRYRQLGMDLNHNKLVIFFHNFIYLFIFEFSALQLHPDKNLHPKAEVAFKLILEVGRFFFFFFFKFLF